MDKLPEQRDFLHTGKRWEWEGRWWSGRSWFPPRESRPCRKLDVCHHCQRLPRGRLLVGQAVDENIMSWTPVMVAKMHFFFKAKSSRIPKCHLLRHLFEAEQLKLCFAAPSFRGTARGSGNRKRTRPAERIKERKHTKLSFFPHKSWYHHFYPLFRKLDGYSFANY